MPHYVDPKDFAKLQILLNRAKFCQGPVCNRYMVLHSIMLASGYEDKSKLTIHRVRLYADKGQPRLVFRFSYIDDQTVWTPVRRTGSFIATVDDENQIKGEYA